MESPAPSSSADGVTPEQFLKNLGESGLLAADEVKAVVARTLAATRQDAKQLAAEFVKQGKLTRYQATMIYQGKTRGLVLGNYVILEKIGQGGMGMVFKARQRRLDRIVALKVLAPAVTKNPTAVKRFQREVHAAAKLQHPNIVEAYDAGEDKGVHFLVMEFVEGSDLANLVKKDGPLPPEQAVTCIIQAAHGLAHAHASGIVHRDIKPHNLLLASREHERPESPGAYASGSLGPVKILDMGLARIEGGNTPQSGTSELTQSGSIMGTCDYMSPEQALNTKHADARSDIYSLGCTLYYLLTGQPMFGGETAMEKLMAHTTQPIPPLTSVSPQLQALYQRMVAKKPEERYQSMTEVIADLEKVPAGEAGRKPGASRERKRPEASGGALSETQALAGGNTARERGQRPGKRWLVAGGAILLLGGLAGVVVALVGSPPDKRTASLSTDPGKAATPSSGTVFDDAWVQSVRTAPPQKQAEAVAKKLQELNSGFDGNLEHRIENGVVAEVRLATDKIVDISPLRALRDLKVLHVLASDLGITSRLWDLSPLRGMQLVSLSCGRSKVADLSPLRGMPLRTLDCANSAVSDLTPLKDMQLQHLRCHGTAVADLTPLKGMPLKTLNANWTKISDLAPLKGMALTVLGCQGTGVTDLSVIKDMPLELLTCSFVAERDAAILRSINTLKTINNKPKAEFWKEVDAKKQ
jgi:serine/threonine protein kinase